MSLQVPSLSLSAPLPPVVSPRIGDLAPSAPPREVITKQPSVVKPELSVEDVALPPYGRPRPPLSAEDVKAVEVVLEDQKPFILACSRPLKPEELDLLKSYGKVLVFHESFRNIPLSQHQFDYAVFDLMEKVHRDTLAKEDLNKYHVVCIIGLLDGYDDFASDLCAVNCVRTFPARQAFQSEFNRLLLAKKVRKPSIFKSAIRFLCGLASGLQQE